MLWLLMLLREIKNTEMKLFKGEKRNSSSKYNLEALFIKSIKQIRSSGVYSLILWNKVHIEAYTKI